MAQAEKEFSTQFVKHTFTEEEKRQIAQDMAQKVSELAQLEDQKKAVASQIKSEIDKKQAEVNISATHLNTGYEMRSVKCEVERDYKRRIVRYIRTDNGQLGREVPMTADELQKKLPLEN
jgi:hypothetical protein